MSSRKSYNTGLLLLRLTLGVLMLFHGIAKLSKGVEGISNNLAELGIPGFLAYAVFIGEIIAPLLIIVGYRTRIAALIFAFNMLVAALLSHPNDIFALSRSGAWAVELIGLYFFGAVSLFFTGAGKYAVSTKSWWD